MFKWFKTSGLQSILQYAFSEGLHQFHHEMEIVDGGEGEGSDLSGFEEVI